MQTTRLACLSGTVPGGPTNWKGLGVPGRAAMMQAAMTKALFEAAFRYVTQWLSHREYWSVVLAFLITNFLCVTYAMV